MSQWRHWSLCGVVLLLLTALAIAQSPPHEIRVVSKAGPGIIPISEFSGTQMIPLRGAVSFVGASVRPGSEPNVVTVSGNGKMARISDGRNFVPVAANLELLQSPARLVGGEWFVPLDFLAKVLPSLSTEAVAYRASDRLLILGDDFPEVKVRSRHAPTFTRIFLDSDRVVPLAIEEVEVEAEAEREGEAESVIRVTLDTPFLRTSYRGETNIDDVVERISLEREESTYVLVVELGEHYGSLRTERRDNGIVLTLVRSRVPNRGRRTADEFEWDLSEQEQPEDGEAEDGKDALNPNAEIIELAEDYHLPAAPPELPSEPGGPARLRIVTLDPGHGGAETGAEGQGGSLEKGVVLSICRRFRQLLQTRLGIRVILTRDGDSDLSLDERAAFANSNKSDLFISIHADASPRRNARGSSVYFLSYSSTAQNASSGGDDLDFILWDMAQASHLRQSSQLAEIMQEELQAVTVTERVNRGIKQNTFRVLKGATMPAVLVEVGFISNAKEERLLGSADYQDKLAEALYRGLVRYKDIFERGGSADRTRRSQR